MHYARFRDPAGSIREGTYDPDADTVAFGGDEYALDDPAIDVLRRRTRRRSSVSGETTPTTRPNSETTCRTGRSSS